MEEVLDIVVLGRACRNASNIKQRQPMSEMYVKNDVALNEFYKEIIEDELNVKEVTFREDVSEFTGYTFKPQLRTLGKRFGKQINAVKEALLALDSAKAMAELNATGSVTVTIDGVDEQIAKDDLLIEAKKVDGYVSDSDGKITVVMNTTLTPELIEEGYVREVISKVQTMRKEADFEVMDHIVLAISGSDKLDAICATNEAEIRRVVLADKLVCGSAAAAVTGYTKDWNINGEDVTVTVAKV